MTLLEQWKIKYLKKVFSSQVVDLKCSHCLALKLFVLYFYYIDYCYQIHHSVDIAPLPKLLKINLTLLKEKESFLRKNSFKSRVVLNFAFHSLNFLIYWPWWWGLTITCWYSKKFAFSSFFSHNTLQHYK